MVFKTDDLVGFTVDNREEKGRHFLSISTWEKEVGMRSWFPASSPPSMESTNSLDKLPLGGPH